MDWGGMDGSTLLAAGGESALWAISPLDVRNLFVDPTVIRHQLLIAARTTTTIAGFGMIAVGVIQHSGDPDAATVPADPPDPVGDPEADWAIVIRLPIAPGTPVGTSITPVTDWLTQSSAMRRLGNTMGLLVVLEAAGFGVDVSFSYRYLLKE